MNLQTTYMGLNLSSPIVVSACTLSEDTSNIVQMEDNGAGAVVLFSLFEEQIRRKPVGHETMIYYTSDLNSEPSKYYPALDDFNVGAEEYLEKIRDAKQRVNIPIIASLNGITSEGWIDYSRQIEQAGADALEINVFYIPAETDISSPSVEHKYLNILTEVKNTVSIPVAIKLNPYFSSIGNMAARLHGAGADGLVLFNRFYQPDFDINQLKIISSLHLSEADEIRLPLLWIGLLYGKVPVSIAASTGVQSAIEVIKYVLAGANVVMTASALYKNGIHYIKTMNKEVAAWMNTMELDSIPAFRGFMSQQNIADPIAYERANYMKILNAKR